MKRKRVYLVDPFSMVRLSIAEWLRATPDLDVCGQSDRLSRAQGAIDELKPDIVVAEIFSQEDLNFLKSIHQKHPSLPILVYSCGDEIWCAPQALEAGAGSYVPKNAPVSSLIDGIRRALQGEILLSRRTRFRLRSKSSQFRASGRATSAISRHHCRMHRSPRRRAD